MTPALPRTAPVASALIAAAMFVGPLAAQPIDRAALVRRHAIALTAPDRHAPVMLGNGALGFTADITGLQSFPSLYSELSPLLTMAQWAWHSVPNPKNYREADGLVQVPVAGRGEQPYAWMKSFDAVQTNPALGWLRANPHRISLARIAMTIDGAAPDAGKLTQTRQTLDLWSGTLTSRFVYAGQPVTVVTRVHPTQDLIEADVTSPLVASGRLAVSVRYPGVSDAINPDPSRWDDEAGGKTAVLVRTRNRIRLSRTIDATRYWSTVVSNGSVSRIGPAFVRATGTGDRLTVAVRFERAAAAPVMPALGATASETPAAWRRFWTTGGAVDFSGSTDPRARELERRVVLSQYLSAVNGAGELPPQEEGLFSNSWFGKFHLEMHPWHAAWQAMWGRPELLERSLGWYVNHLAKAREEAARHRIAGAWWPKMTGPGGRNSPSPVSPFLMWQQPHPILLAELVWRTRRDRATLDRYAALVEETAALLAAWPLNGRDLGPPLIPAQENYDPLTTKNPTFEVEYFRWGLTTAQSWRERRGLRRRPDWDRTLARIAPPPTRDGLYLPVESLPDFWRTAASPACKAKAEALPCRNRDHPSFLMAYGFIPGARIDPATMRRTFAATEANWDFRQTWGWDFPMMAMTAARLGMPDKAVDWLFAPQKNNQWGTTGMTPRVHLDAHAADLVPTSGGAGGVAMAQNPDGPGYRRAAETYFPSNGSLLMAVGLMAGGWDGSHGPAPGFPKTGWRVRAEGITPAP